MKITRRRRPLRPQPSRAQVRQQTDRLRRHIHLLRTEWVLEAARPNRNPLHLLGLHDRILACQDAIDAREAC
jgi:hypothetical protein